MSRRRTVLAIAVAASMAALVGALAAPARPSPPRTDPGCLPAFPRLVLHDGDVDGLVVCSDRAGSATLIRNQTAAVWVVASPSSLAVPVLPLDPVARSFMDLVRDSGSYIPSGAAAVVPAPVARVALTVEARLTLAQLAHDQLVRTLARREGPAPDSLRTTPSSARRALSACLLATIEHVDSPECALADGAPAAVLAEAAAAVDAGGRSPCGAAWIEAKLAADLPAGDVTPFASDIVAWEASAVFTERGEAASGAYRAIRAEGGT